MINRRCGKFSPGFTLIEIMVALIIFGVLAVTLLTRLGDNIRVEQSLEAKTIASTIAENTLAELRIKEEWSAVRNDNRTVSYAGSKWRIKTTVADTANENLRRVDVQVGPVTEQVREENFVITLTSFIGRY